MIEVYQIAILIFSAVFHEYMHGFAADRLGDPTARQSGRLTLNPIPHLDPIGSVFLPLLLILSRASFVIGWAKPVPYNPYNLRDRRYGEAKVALAGPAANLILAVVFGLILRFVPVMSQTFAILLASIVYINLVLMVFNLIPIPPLDGSKILASLLPWDIKEKYLRLERYSLVILVLFIFVGFDWLLPIVSSLFRLIVG